MSQTGLRGRRVAELVQEELGLLLIREFREPGSGIVTVTRVEMSPDLLAARIFLSVFGSPEPEKVLAGLESRKGFFRKALASRIKLKYNPALFFALDPGPEHADRIDRIIERTRKDGT